MARKKQVTDIATMDTGGLMDEANKGNAEALQLLRKKYQENPDLSKRFTKLSRCVEDARLTHMLRASEGNKLAISESMAYMVRKLAGENPTPLERLLAERIAMCWLDVQDHELQYSAMGSDTLTKYEWRSRMLDRANNRYLKAIKVLAVVRRLQLPAIQVNIGDKQVNIASPSPECKQATTEICDNIIETNALPNRQRNKC